MDKIIKKRYSAQNPAFYQDLKQVSPSIKQPQESDRYKAISF